MFLHPSQEARTKQRKIRTFVSGIYATRIDEFISRERQVSFSLPIFASTFAGLTMRHAFIRGVSSGRPVGKGAEVHTHAENVWPGSIHSPRHSFGCGSWLRKRYVVVYYLHVYRVGKLISISQPRTGAGVDLIFNQCRKFAEIYSRVCLW